MDLHREPRQSRRSVRLQGYDYSQAGGYFVTIVAAGRECLFGRVEDGEVGLSELGRIVETEWLRAPEVRDGVELDAFVVMPNHVHGILVFDGAGDAERATCRSPLPGGGDVGRASGPGRASLGSLVGCFKASVTAEARRGGLAAASVWQRGYFEHVIRSDKALMRLRRYIEENPWHWADDEENPARPAR
ncbi:MAG: transposase [Armatimonadetes bacterium]|nr:transposase [Armatimonadota bacterium]